MTGLAITAATLLGLNPERPTARARAMLQGRPMVRNAVRTVNFHFSTGIFPFHSAGCRASCDPCQNEARKDP
jgi:hypothetical protein